MAKVLKNYISHPDLIISSYALRALTTAEFFAAEFGYKDENIQIHDALYMCSTKTILEILKDTNDDAKTVFLFGHNPELTEFCNKIDHHKIDNMPTCGIYCTSFDTAKWCDIDFGKGEVKFFEYPKKYFK